MLINKKNESVEVRYNGKSRILAPSESIDIRDFDIDNKHVAGAEKHIMNKHPGVFDQKPTIGDLKVEGKYTEQIKNLEGRIETLVKELSDVRASERIAQEKHSSSVGEVEAMKQNIASMKKEVDKYKFEKDELESENQKLREQVSKQRVKI